MVWARTKFLSINPLPTIAWSLFVSGGDPFLFGLVLKNFFNGVLNGLSEMEFSVFFRRKEEALTG